ncbi:MAG TPA: DNA-binding protein [Ruminococcaceae bacterium]|nr:DNA-binding protein [Oscillospiraceae bacterium]
MPKDLKTVEYYDTYSPLLTERQREAMEMYYYSDLSLTEIAQETGVTRQAAFNTIKKSELRLCELENAMKLMEKRKKAEKNLDLLKPLLNDKKQGEKLIEEIRELFN